MHFFPFVSARVVAHTGAASAALVATAAAAGGCCTALLWWWRKRSAARAAAIDDECNDNVRMLKNALLCDAMFRHLSAARHECEPLLPPLPVRPAGSDYEHACASYLVPRDVFRRSPFYTREEERRHDLIRAYVCRALGSPKHAAQFLHVAVAPSGARSF